MDDYHTSLSDGNGEVGAPATSLAMDNHSSSLSDSDGEVMASETSLGIDGHIATPSDDNKRVAAPESPSYLADNDSTGRSLSEDLNNSPNINMTDLDSGSDDMAVDQGEPAESEQLPQTSSDGSSVQPEAETPAEPSLVLAQPAAPTDPNSLQNEMVVAGQHITLFAILRMGFFIHQPFAFLYFLSKIMKPRPTPRTFHEFRKLPIELRLRIWALSVTQPQPIRVEDIGGVTKLLQGTWIRHPLLLVNKEARREALRFMEDFNSGPSDVTTRNPAIYFNIDADCLWISKPSHEDLDPYASLDKFRNGLFQRLRSFAISLTLWSERLGGREISKSLWLFELRLEVLVIILEGHHDTCSKSVKLIAPRRTGTFDEVMVMINGTMTNAYTRSRHQWRLIGKEEEQVVGEIRDLVTEIFDEHMGMIGDSIDDIEQAKESLRRDGIRDLRGWKVPRIEFTEVVPASYEDDFDN